MPARNRLAAVIPHRPRVGAVTSLLIALGFAALIAPAVTAETWLRPQVVAHQPAAMTVRVPPFGGADDGPRGGGVVVGRGEVPDVERAADARLVVERLPAPASAIAAYFAILFALIAIYSHHLRRSNRGRLLRVQLVNLGILVAGVIAVKVLMLTTTLSVLVVPVAVAAIVPTLVFDRVVGLATGVLSALVFSMTVPFDLGVATILLAQASVAGLIVPDLKRSPTGAALIGGACAALGAGALYGIYLYLATGVAPWGELARPLASPWVAALAGGGLAMVIAPLAIPAYQLIVAEISHRKLVALEDLAHPLLRQIATKAPGTWQHSLAMANMAELAANAIGASGRLVRVGAYFHDLGKSLQPKYFIENLEPGETSPHERLAPEVSCDAIFAHVTEGLAVARRAKLHERIVDFMHMHHGNGVLEYFWGRCQEQGNPNRRTVEDFRYPGVPPQSRETAILAICDAVEAASRTLKKADEPAISNLVQRIVYGKLHLGQLDDSGLSMSDLRQINDSLRETIKHAHHGRIEYPWQKAEAAEAAAATTSDATTAPQPAPETTTQRLMQEPRLDSLDVPRPMWQRTRTPSGSQVADPSAIATTAVMNDKASASGKHLSESDAALSVAATYPPGELSRPTPEPQPVTPAPTPAPAATIATPSTVMAAVVAQPVVGIAPTTIPGVSKDRVTPAGPRPAVEARGSQPRTAVSADAPTDHASPPAKRDSRPPRPPPGSRGGAESRPPDEMSSSIDPINFTPPPPGEESGDVISSQPAPAPGTPARTSERPKRTRQPALIVDDPLPPAPPPAPDPESASTQPRIAVFRPSQALPLPAPPPSDPSLEVPAPAHVARRQRRPSDWSQGLADRVDAFLEDEKRHETPVANPAPGTLSSLAGNPEETRQTPIHEIEALVRESVAVDTQEEDLFDGWEREDRGALARAVLAAPKTEPQAAQHVPEESFADLAEPGDAVPRPADPGRDGSRRTSPPPPPRGEASERIKRETQEVLPEDVEASIEEAGPRAATGLPPRGSSSTRTKRE